MKELDACLRKSGLVSAVTVFPFLPRDLPRSLPKRAATTVGPRDLHILLSRCVYSSVHGCRTRPDRPAASSFVVVAS